MIERNQEAPIKPSVAGTRDAGSNPTIVRPRWHKAGACIWSRFQCYRPLRIALCLIALLISSVVSLNGGRLIAQKALVSVAPVAPQPVFANICVTVHGPNSVKIEWSPLNGADLYLVYRNGNQIGPEYRNIPAGTPLISAVDNSAPTNARITYKGTASHMTTIHGLLGTPGVGVSTNVETLTATSNSVEAVTPALPVTQAPQVVLSGWADLHTHLMSNLAFGGKLFHGAPDAAPAGGSLLRNADYFWHMWQSAEEPASAVKERRALP